jgi:hemoglobin-like flavoprotein
MTPAQVNLIKQSFEKVLPIKKIAADLFYDRLFELDPPLRKLFPEDMTEQKMRLMTALSFVIAGLDRLEEITPALESLGRSHAGYGARKKDYETVGAALLWTLAQGLGSDWNEELKAAWAAAYGAIADTMQSAYEDA